MVQIKLKGVIGVEHPSPKSFWCGVPGRHEKFVDVRSLLSIRRKKLVTETPSKVPFPCWKKHCNTMQRTATHCSSLQVTATHCNSLQLTATHCNYCLHFWISAQLFVALRPAVRHLGLQNCKWNLVKASCSSPNPVCVCVYMCV